MDAEVFEKDLTITDTSYHMLLFPTRHLNVLPPVVDEHDPVEFEVRCGDQMYTFLCRKRHGEALKPVIERGWSDVVRKYGLKVDDVLKFYREPNHNGVTPYRIELYRWKTYTDEMGTAKSRRRIV